MIPEQNDVRDTSHSNEGLRKYSSINEDIESQRSILEDILPSFQMHNYMFNRTLYDETEESVNNDLPDYASEINTLRSTRPIDPNSFVDPTENPNLILLNNTDKLPSVDAPVDIKIVLTKRQPMIGKVFEKESPLTQYKPGDLVTGYVTIKSHLEVPLAFEMMLVSLEGELKTPAGGLKSVDRKIISRTFLKMYDLNACFHAGHIPVAAYGTNGLLQKDSSDDTFIGFDEHRSIIPGFTHKKFFTFKLPYSLLDTTCPDQIQEHLRLLPSFGFDEQSLGGLEENLEIDPVLGYKRCEDVYGSPIKVNDMALKGQSISYFIRVQMIGRRDVAKKFVRKLPKNNGYPFVVLKNENYHFRVDTSKNQQVETLNESMIGCSGLINTNVRTYEQLTHFENFVIKTLKELRTKKQLAEGGIVDRREQDDIIASLEVDESKKLKQFPSSTNYHEEIVRSDSEHFLHYDTLKLGKDLFGRSGGEVVIKASMSRDSSIHSIKCFALKEKHSHSNLTAKSGGGSDLVPFRTVENERTRSVPVKPLSSNSSASLETIRSLHSLKQAIQEHCFVEFDLTFVPDNKSGFKPELPQSLTVNSTLKSINIYSTFPIPVSIDGEFLMDEQLLQYTIPNIRRQFNTYLIELKQLVGQVPVPRPFYNSVNSLSKLSAKEAYVPKFDFLTETMNLQNKWKFDEKSKVYKAYVKIPLAVSSKQINNSNACLVPSFQSCLVNQFYMVHFHVSMKKSKKYCVFKFPLRVV